MRRKGWRSGRVIGKLRWGWKVCVEWEWGGWGKVRVNGKRGYVRRGYLGMSTPAKKGGGNKVARR